MEGKIRNEWGDEAAKCVAGLGHGDIPKIVECIVKIVEDTDPVVVTGKLTAWSIECIF